MSGPQEQWEERAVWEDDQDPWEPEDDPWAADEDPWGADDDADDQVRPPSAPLAQPGAYNLPYPRSAEQEAREERRERQWPYADDKPWDPDPDRDQDELRHHTAPWPLPQPRPIQEPEP